MNAVDSPQEQINEESTYLDHAYLLRFVFNCSVSSLWNCPGTNLHEFYMLQKLKKLMKHPLIQHRVLHMDHMTWIIQNLSLNQTVKDARHSSINMLNFQRMHTKFLLSCQKIYFQHLLVRIVDDYIAKRLKLCQEYNELCNSI